LLSRQRQRAVANLVAWASQELGVAYCAAEAPIEDFSCDPAEAPVLYLSGRRAFALDARTRRRLRRFIERGGFLIADAEASAKAFVSSFLR